MNNMLLKTLKTARCRFAILPLVALGMISGCRRDSPSALETDQPPPASLRQARLLFQRPDGIYLAKPSDGHTVRVTINAAYPRWFPDGRRFVFIRQDRVMLHDTTDASERELAHSSQIRALAVNRANGDVFLATANGTYRIAPGSGNTEPVPVGGPAYELSACGPVLITTERLPLRGFGIKRYSLATDDESILLGRGCSASLSPNGTRATLNLNGHRELALLDVRTGDTLATLSAPPDTQLDNQYWSNHPDWITAVSHKGDIFLQRVTDGTCWRITRTGDADRPDLFVP